MNILLVEDDKYLAIGIQKVLNEFGSVNHASSLTDAKSLVSKIDFDLAIIDIMLDSKSDGLQIISHCTDNNIPSIVLSSTDQDSITEQAYKNGCKHFLTKRDYKDHLADYIERHIKINQANHLDNFFNSKYITKNEFLIKQITDIAQINIKNKSILISGQTGVGKSLIGKLIHDLNFSKEDPLIHINCSEVPESLIESELFGHKKGSFTGATSNREGLLEKANNGVLFLDEIGTMPLIMQKKLLKAIDEKTFTPVGSNQQIKSNFTLITATCEDLFEKIYNKDFRKDLFYRISGLHLSIPSLEERKEDIDLLINHYLKYSHRKVILTSELREKLSSYNWPGNVRELIKTLEKLIAKSSGIIDTDDFIPMKDDFISKSEENHLISEYQKSLIKENGLKNFIKLIEKQVINDCLDSNNGKIAQTIQQLGISASTFYRVTQQK